MKWLLLCDAQAAPGGVEALLGAAQACLAPGADWIPVGRHEKTIEAEGPPDLPARIEGRAGVKAVYPSSEPVAY